MSLKKDYSSIEVNYDDYNRNPLISHNLNSAKSQVYSQLARKGVTYEKYQQLCGARQERVRQLMVRGYPQSLIASKLHVSQPTISRDIHLINQDHNKESKDYSTEQLGIDQYLVRREINEHCIQLWELLDKTKSPTLFLKIITMLTHLSERKQKMLPYDMVIADLLVREKLLKKKENDLLLKEKLLEAEREQKKMSWAEFRYLWVDSDTFVI
jgi:Trp operon repressor